MVGGGLFVGASYYYLYLTGEAGVRIDFNIGGINSATEGGAGPLKIEGRDPQEFANGDVSGNNDSNVSGGNAGLSKSPSGGGSGMGGWLTDLRDDGPYSKTWMEREKSQRRDSGEEKV